MSKPLITQSFAGLGRRNDKAALPHDNSLLGAIDIAISPACILLSLWALAFRYEGELPPAYLMLSVIVFAVTFPGPKRLLMSPTALVFDIALNWVWLVALMGLTGFATGYWREFSFRLLQQWAWVAPCTELLATVALRAAAPALLAMQGAPRKAIIVGMNEQGLDLARNISTSSYSRVQFTGFVDSRNSDRLASNHEFPLLGPVDQIAELVKRYRIQLIYLSLPMASQPRILKVLDELKDTTASIFFVPNMFVTDLIQGRPVSVCGTPVISVCDTPFRGYNGAIKRASDCIFSALILILIFPLMVVIAIAIKATSSGPIIFKQRRYGLDGEEILIYKFRSMTVTDDGPTITQATKGDQRITPLGAILRRTSLDELPQFVNVLQGRMSIVGPRPHAVAHNEMYRKVIKGYMVRHKVKPGITGWAQVSGYRGETATLDQMQARINHDLEYLRNWSLRLDMHIIAKTVKLIIRDQKAY